MAYSGKISLVIPVFNEGAVLDATISQLVQFRNSNEYYFYIIIVNDGSSDRACEKLDEKKLSDVIVLNHEFNLGQGAALSTGLNYAKSNEFDILITFDADGQHSPSDINKLISPLINQEIDVVLGSRFLQKSTANQIPVSRKILLKLALIVDNFLSGINKTDVHNGLRSFGKNAIQKINIKAPGMEHASEIIWEINSKNLNYLEVPVDISYTAYSMSKQKSYVFPIITLFRIFRYYVKYNKLKK